MKKLDKILCPFDFSEFAEIALGYAIKLADDGTKITLANIIHIPKEYDLPSFVFTPTTLDELTEVNKTLLDEKIEKLNVTYPNINFDYVIYAHNEPSETILNLQVENKYDMIVMGSHGRKGINRILMGSVSEQVMRNSDCPVLIVKK